MFSFRQGLKGLFKADVYKGGPEFGDDEFLGGGEGLVEVMGGYVIGEEGLG